MENRNVAAFAQCLFDDEAFRRLNVFEVNTPESRLQRCDDIDKFLRVGFVHFQIENIDIGELLEQNRLAFHHRLGRQRANRAKAQHRRTVRNHANQVTARGVICCGIGVFNDFLARKRNARRIGQGKVTLVCKGGGCRYGQFPRGGIPVIVQSCFAQLVISICHYNTFDFRYLHKLTVNRLNPDNSL